MTAQISDSLSINGEKVSLQGCLALPWNDPRLIEMSEEEAEERSQSLAIGCSFCWRQYIASWKIVDDRLFLADIEGIYRWEGELPVFAHWVTDIVRIGEGDMLHYVHMGFGSVYERDVLLDVRQGRVVGRTVRNNEREPFDPVRAGFDNLPSEDTVTPGLSTAQQWDPRDFLDE